MAYQKRRGFYARFESRIDAEPVVVLVSRNPSSNRKTGPMISAAIVHEHVPPHEAQRTGDDASVCGQCALRPLLAKRNAGPRCYVLTAYSLRAQWNAFEAGRYEEYDPDRDRIRLPLRIGSYGDPCAVPLEFWKELLRHTRAWTGYTHRWRENPEYRELLMASVDSEAELYEAWNLGWRTYRVRQAEDQVLPGEFVCPASNEGGHQHLCFTCRACDGVARGGKKVSPVVIVHGNSARRKVA